MPLFDQPDSLEPAYRDAYTQWRAGETPSSTGHLLRTIDPEISRGINAYVGQSNPLIRSQAKKLALQAVRTYDPGKGAKLGTHVVNQLQGLKRINRRQIDILRVPERVGLEKQRAKLAEQELVDELGREPSLTELADHTGLSMKRLKYLRKFNLPTAEGTFSDMGNESLEFAPRVQSAASDDPWLDLVYGDLDPVGQKIMEWTLGLNGEPIRSNYDIAEKLGLSPGAISQRKAKIQAMLNEGIGSRSLF